MRRDDEPAGKRGTKIFGLGLSRTGTLSLHTALELLGYSSLHFPWPRFKYGRLGASVGLRQMRLQPGVDRRFDALLDISVLLFWKQLDAAHPGAKFVLTIREKESWLDSCGRFPPLRRDSRPKPELRALRKRIYGTVFFDRKRFSEAYDRHHRDVHEYFRGREDDLLMLDVCGGQGFERLCPFLGRDVPARGFPWENDSRKREE